jgi:hypothetical protein
MQVSFGDVRLWDARSGQPVGPVHSSVSSAGAAAAAFSNDGSRFAASLGLAAVVLWNTRDGTLALELPVRARSNCFSPDDRRLVTTSNDTTAQCWDVASGLPLSEPMVHAGRVVSSAFSPDARFLCTEVAQTQTFNTSFCLWPLSPETGGAPVPEWLLQLATAVAGHRIDESGRCIAAPEALSHLSEVQQTLAALPADAPFADWGRWILASGPERPIAPGFSLTPEEADALTARLAAEPPVDNP